MSTLFAKPVRAAVQSNTIAKLPLIHAIAQPRVCNSLCSIDRNDEKTQFDRQTTNTDTEIRGTFVASRLGGSIIIITSL